VDELTYKPQLSLLFHLSRGRTDWIASWHLMMGSENASSETDMPLRSLSCKLGSSNRNKELIHAQRKRAD
jgi:hypothetical protein